MYQRTAATKANHLMSERFVKDGVTVIPALTGNPMMMSREISVSTGLGPQRIGTRTGSPADPVPSLRTH